MIALPWDPLGYTFWYVTLGAALTLAERIRPWRRQGLLRPGIGFDLFLVLFNGLVLGVILGALTAAVSARWEALHLPWWTPPLLIALPLWAQFLIVVVVKDFAEWLVHNLLHRVPWLWEFHKLHHSITTMDWLGNMRFHWMEVIVYRTLLWLPLSLFVVEWRVALALAVFSTLVGHLNHSNLNLGWGPLRYVFNSPRFHIWHHDAESDHTRPHGSNFAIIFTCWDWLFGTARLPTTSNAPARLGYAGQEQDPLTPGRRWWWVGVPVTNPIPQEPR